MADSEEAVRHAADSGETLRHAAAAWAAVGLSHRRAELDQQSLALVDAQEQSAAGREALKAAVRDFRQVPADDRPARIGGLIKSFQAETDALSRRAAFAEAAFFALYHALESAPDPAPLLAAAVEATSRLAKLEVEAADALAELAEYRTEALSLKNQDLTVRRLQAQLREAEDAREALVAAELAKRVAAASAERAAAEAAAEEREAEATAREEAARAELRTLRAERDEAHERLFRLREESDARAHAQSQQLELLLSEVDEREAQLARLHAERARLEAALAAAAGPGAAAGALAGAGAGSGGGGAGAASASAAAAREEVAQVRTAQRLAEAAREQRAAAEAAERQLAAKEAALQLANRAAERAAAEARAAEAEADVLRARVAALEAAGVPAAAGAGGSGGSGSAEAAAARDAGAWRATTAGVERDEAERQLARARADASDALSALSAERVRSGELEALLASAREVLEQTEARLLALSGLPQLQHQLGAAHAQAEGGAASTLEQLLAAGGAGSGSAAETAGAASPNAAAGAQPARAPPSAEHAADSAEREAGALPSAAASTEPYVEVLVSQRNRFKAEAVERAQEAARAKAQLQALQARSEQLGGENLRLYERLRFLEAYKAGGGTAHDGALRPAAGGAQPGSSGGESGASVERKYRRLYEESLNPFAAFSRKERLQRYQELNGIEKLMLSMSSLVLASKRARMGLAVYVLCLHALTMAALYGISHVRTCDRTRAALPLAGASSM